MAKYSFDRIDPTAFEALVQALLERQFRTQGALTQFGPGADGAREATWTQQPEHEHYVRPSNEASNVPKEWVFQVKYHDIGQRGWKESRSALEAELKKELKKLIETHKVKCHSYVLITNVPFTGTRTKGTKDRISEAIEQWRQFIPEIQVWDAVDLSRMLDADPSTRQSYLDVVLPGDILQKLLGNLEDYTNSLEGTLRAYLLTTLKAERYARTEDANDEGSQIPLQNIFIDLNLSLLQGRQSPAHTHTVTTILTRTPETVIHTPQGKFTVPSSSALLPSPHPAILLLGGPGVGKSTLTQFLALYHASRVVQPALVPMLSERLKLGNASAADIDATCRVRFPLRIELRRYAQWISAASERGPEPFLADFIATAINAATSGSLTREHVFRVARDNPLLLVLDGLDEVPDADLRKIIFDQVKVFLARCDGQHSDVQLIVSSRPQGYRQECNDFGVVEWLIEDLPEDDFYRYSELWLQGRIAATDERKDAMRRIEEGMQAPSVQQLAKTLLQATVMLTIASRKQAIPHARHELFSKYVDVVFAREKSKDTVRGKHEELQRLHDRVGFALMSKMERSPTDSKAISAGEFKGFVFNVLQEYGDGDFGGKTLGDVAEDIVRMAKDRLCLLAGKGEDQEDMEFVIPQFREYFAARYLHKNPDVDSDKVFTALVERGAFWANVLQFYAAAQSASDQKSWIAEADGRDTDQGVVPPLVRLVQRRRALAQLLPEFQRPRNADVRRAVDTLFEASTRWTWYAVQDAPTLVAAYAPVQTAMILEEGAALTSPDDLQALVVELEWIAVIVGARSKVAAASCFAEALQSLLSRPLAIAVALENDLPIDLGTTSASEILEALREKDVRPMRHPRRYAKFTEYSPQTAFELRVCRLPSRFLRPPEEQSWMEQAASAIWGADGTADFGWLEIYTAPFLAVTEPGPAISEVLGEIEKVQGPVARFVEATIQSRIHPLDAEANRAARRRYSDLPEIMQSSFNEVRLLGPSPDRYASDEEWSESRAVLLEAAKQCRLQGSAPFGADAGRVAVLLFHPAEWSRFKDVLGADAIQELLGSPFATLLNACPTDVQPIHVETFSIDLGEHLNALCDAALSVCEAGKQHRLLEMQDLAALLLHPTQSMTVESASRLMERALLAESCPRMWLAAIVTAAASFDDIDESLLSQLWMRVYDATIPEHIGGDERRVSIKVVTRLVASGHPERLALAARLAAYIGPGPVADLLREQIAEKIIELLVNSVQPDVIRKALLSSYLYLPTHIQELVLWSDPIRFRQALTDVRQLGGRLANRIAHIGQSQLSAEVRGSCVDRLFSIVENRRLYPQRVAVAAINSLCRISESARGPINEEELRRIISAG